jgi:hypothetical protein
MAAATTILQRVQKGETYAGETHLEVVTCPVCGIVYALPATMLANARKRGKWDIMWYCPNGHQLGFGENEAETELARLKKTLERQSDRAGRLAADLDQTRAELRGQKARGTRFKHERDRERQRVANGVCPCCSRHFEDLASHMANKHPDHGHPKDD